jgi:hypothetical protein
VIREVALRTLGSHITAAAVVLVALVLVFGSQLKQATRPLHERGGTRNTASPRLWLSTATSAAGFGSVDCRVARC